MLSCRPKAAQTVDLPLCLEQLRMIFFDRLLKREACQGSGWKPKSSSAHKTGSSEYARSSLVDGMHHRLACFWIGLQGSYDQGPKLYPFRIVYDGDLWLLLDDAPNPGKQIKTF